MQWNSAPQQGYDNRGGNRTRPGTAGRDNTANSRQGPGHSKQGPAPQHYAHSREPHAQGQHRPQQQQQQQQQQQAAGRGQPDGQQTAAMAAALSGVMFASMGLRPATLSGLHVSSGLLVRHLYAQPHMQDSCAQQITPGAHCCGM
jgi:hypothetical protein